MADTPKESEMGLMYRASMPKDHGMIFDFRPAREVTMWMKNCLFPQDMLFLDSDGTVLAIAENARPGCDAPDHSRLPDRRACSSSMAASAKELGLKPGDKVKHKLFGNG